MRVMLFGVLAERAGTDRVEVEATSVDALRRELEQRIPGLPRLSYAIAVDRVLVNDDRALSGNEEIALLPPFAGG
ncbi:MAG TPA: MoaD/ThiS family protein [Flavobacteriales bacterium]